MIKRIFAIILLTISIGGLYLQWKSRPLHHPPGILAAEKPHQVKLRDAIPFEHEDYQITPLANFELTARLLSRENYYFDREADLSPVDFALGWDKMSDEAVLEKISIWQNKRFYYWKTDRFPIPRRQIETSSANMHLIPADEDIADLIDDVRVGHIITLKGQLVSVEHAAGWKWRSSLTRGDTGAGACELFWVTSLTNLSAD